MYSKVSIKTSLDMFQHVSALTVALLNDLYTVMPSFVTGLAAHTQAVVAVHVALHMLHTDLARMHADGNGLWRVLWSGAVDADLSELQQWHQHVISKMTSHITNEDKNKDKDTHVHAGSGKPR